MLLNLRSHADSIPSALTKPAIHAAFRAFDIDPRNKSRNNRMTAAPQFGVQTATSIYCVLDDERPAAGLVDHLVAERQISQFFPAQRRPVVESG
jgi:hypothetical protein